MGVYIYIDPVKLIKSMVKTKIRLGNLEISFICSFWCFIFVVYTCMFNSCSYSYSSSVSSVMQQKCCTASSELIWIQGGQITFYIHSPQPFSNRCLSLNSCASFLHIHLKISVGWLGKIQVFFSTFLSN